MTYAEIMNDLMDKAHKTWPGTEGSNRASKLEAFLEKTLTQYSEKLGFSKLEILQAFEGRRDYCVVNYYQESNFPSLEDVTVYETQAELQAAIPNYKFRCPSCKGISTNPYECNSGIERKDGKVCNWKAYGLFGTAGRGHRFTIKDTFLQKPIVDDIFMPLDLEDEAEGAKQ